MPDGWEGYDLAVESGDGLVCVSVKTRSESDGWKASKWFNFDDRRNCGWIGVHLHSSEGDKAILAIPNAVAKLHANVPGAKRKYAHFRDISWVKLSREPLFAYEELGTQAVTLRIARRSGHMDCQRADDERITTH